MMDIHKHARKSKYEETGKIVCLQWTEGHFPFTNVLPSNGIENGMELHCIELDSGGGKLGTSNIMNGIDPKTYGERHNHILGYVGAAMWEGNADYVSRCR